MDEKYAGGTATPKEKAVTLAQRWQSLDSKKLPLIRRCEDYSLWTLPYVFPTQGMKTTEMQGPIDSTGARAVNHLSNKLIMTLFQPYSPFFRLTVSSDITAELNEAAQAGDAEAVEILANLDKTLAQAEQEAMRNLDYNRFRTEATTVAKSLIITGNALMYLPDEGRVQSYGLRDYCVARDLSGNVVELMTRDKKSFNTFSKDVQDILRASKKGKYDKDNCEVTIYTRVLLKDDGKYHLEQSADDVKLDSTGHWTPEELPYIVLTWNLVRGEDYGRGLVEDYAGAFHGLHVLNNSLIDMVGIAADIKFLVDPSSMIDVKALNDSESGTYHTGKEGDITTPEFNKIQDMQFVEAAIQRFQQQIGQAFLLNSSVTRDAERVTAEEIRYVAQELELSHGGIYSRFAEEWQLRIAILKLRSVDIKIGKSKMLYPQIITGLDSLSRAGDLDNLRMFVADLQLLEGVPEDIRAVIDPSKFAQFIGIRRGVDYEKFLKSAAQIQGEQEQAMAMQDAQVQQQVGAQVATEAGKAAVQQ
jgi:hypothetical protein